jgi:hypothetical protein
MPPLPLGRIIWGCIVAGSLSRPVESWHRTLFGLSNWSWPSAGNFRFWHWGNPGLRMGRLYSKESVNSDPREGCGRCIPVCVNRKCTERGKIGPSLRTRNMTLVTTHNTAGVAFQNTALWTPKAVKSRKIAHTISVAVSTVRHSSPYSSRILNPIWNYRRQEAFSQSDQEIITDPSHCPWGTR